MESILTVSNLFETFINLDMSTGDYLSS